MPPSNIQMSLSTKRYHIYLFLYSDLSCQGIAQSHLLECVSATDIWK